MNSSLQSLKLLSKQEVPIHLSFHLTERLPYYIQGPCVVECEVSVQKEHQYYIVGLKTAGEVTVNCQRCLHDFVYSYTHANELAICMHEEVANQLMSTLDCIVQAEDDLNLQEILTDDLHLFIPEKHETCEKHLEYFQKDCKIHPHQ